MPPEGTVMPWAWVKAINKIVLGEPWEDPLCLQQNLPVQLSSWLWLSDQEGIERNQHELQRLGITHVLSTNAMEKPEVENLRSELKRFGIRHHAVYGHDEEWYDMIENDWEECKAFLREVYESRGTVVVHCHAGVNRSGLIACAALMVFEQRTVLDVVELVKKKRFTILTNPSFQRQLCLLAAREGLLGPKPDGFTDDPPVRRRIDFSKWWDK